MIIFKRIRKNNLINGTTKYETVLNFLLLSIFGPKKFSIWFGNEIQYLLNVFYLFSLKKISGHTNKQTSISLLDSCHSLGHRRHYVLLHNTIEERSLHWVTNTGSNGSPILLIKGGAVSTVPRSRGPNATDSVLAPLATKSAFQGVVLRPTSRLLPFSTSVVL